ncbi:hypothetical protein QEN19_004136 [Hanseniaspora menglaensis]
MLTRIPSRYQNFLFLVKAGNCRNGVRKLALNAIVLQESNNSKDISQFMSILNQYKPLDDNPDDIKFDNSAKKNLFPAEPVDAVLGVKGEVSATSALADLKDLLKDLKEKSGIKEAKVPEDEDLKNNMFVYSGLDGIKALPEYLKMEKLQTEKLSSIVATLAKKITNDKEFLECTFQYLMLLCKLEQSPVDFDNIEKPANSSAAESDSLNDTINSSTSAGSISTDFVKDPIIPELVIVQPLIENVKLLLWTMFTDNGISGFIPDFRKLQYLQNLKSESIKKKSNLFQAVDFFNLELTLTWNVYKDIKKVNDVLQTCNAATIFDYNSLVIVTLIENCCFAGGYNGWEEDRFITDLRQLSCYKKIGLVPYLTEQTETSLYTKWYVDQLNNFQKQAHIKINLMKYKKINELQTSDNKSIHPKSSLAKALNELKHFGYKLRKSDLDI